MTLVLYNTLTRRKEPFTPVEDGRVKIYVCGPTVYDHSHIGHARSVIVFDVLVRYLRNLGYQVTYVRNFTDLDDKIINRANEEGVDFRELARRYIESYHRDMDALGALRPEHEPRATKYIGQMTEAVQALLEKGHAYRVDGDVYYDVASSPGYGRLSGRTLEDMRAGARVEVDERKKNPWDFALWKESKPGEPAWPTPWGPPGRPGWHTECLVMSHGLLGDEFDVHGGGLDLVFPHHENELAQAEALGRRFARVWMHNGFVRVNNEKMSKSLKNFFTIKEVLERFDPEVLRLFLLSKHYRSPVDFSDETLEETARGLDRAYRSLELAEHQGVDPSVSPIRPDTKSILAAFNEALDDDLNTAKALGRVFEAVRELNRIFETETGAADLDQAAALVAAIREMGLVLGLLERPPSDYFGAKADKGLAESELTPERIEELIRIRAEARGRKDWAEADRIRNELKARGVILEDAGGQTRWRLE
ncbi:MAG: cysteine--tRNA ligase [Thermodesulfobacteriota bacterium]